MSKTRHHHIFVSRRGKFWLRLFILLAILAIAGVIILVGNKITYIITPEVETLSTPTTIKIDLTASQPVYSLNVIPGRFLNIGENVSKLASQGFSVIFSDNKTIVYKNTDWDKLVDALAQASRASNKITYRPVSVSQSSDWQTGGEGQVYQAFFTINQEVITNFPLETWQKNLSGFSTEDGQIWLQNQSGVASAKIGSKWNFLANFSIKMLNLHPRVVIQLDI